LSISVTHLSKNFGAQKAVNDISFKIGKNEIVGFLGPNGAGKSTTMKMITGYLKPDNGSIEVCGISVQNQPTETQRKIGYLPESNALYLDMYVKEYLSFVGSIYNIDNLQSSVNDVVELVGLTKEAHKKIGQLSKGYKQRVGIAASLVHNPEVLILDEPTSGLDPNQIIEIRDIIKRLAENKTVIFSSHIMQDVEAICERVIIINKGQIVADDQLINLKNKTNENQMVSVEFKEKIASNTFSTFKDCISIKEISQNKFNFETNNAESIRKQIMEFCLSNNLNIVSLNSESHNLEAVFKSLTM
jgi:ABC-2 type transport system ATP-binding protein